MKVAIVGSRDLEITEIDRFVPPEMSVLISGGARGVDTLAERYADRHGIVKIIFKPDYQKFEEKAPLVRNRQIVDLADLVVAIWDGSSRGTKYTIDYARRIGKNLRIFLIEDSGTLIFPGNLGNDCKGRGIFCDECNFFECCSERSLHCTGCEEYCPRKNNY